MTSLTHDLFPKEESVSLKLKGQNDRGIHDIVDFTWTKIFLHGNINRILRYPRADEETVNWSNVK